MGNPPLAQRRLAPDAAVEEAIPVDAPREPLLTRVCAALARACMIGAIAGLIALLAAVLLQVFGRYVLNDTPTWAESLALVLVLYVTLLGAAVGVRDASHIGLDSLLASAPERMRTALELAIHGLVSGFGLLMAYCCLSLAISDAAYKIPTLGISEAFRYAPAVAAGLLIALFSLEHIVARWRGHTVRPSWP